MKSEENKHPLQDQIDNLILTMEKMKIADYMAYINNPRRMLIVNLWAGIARGLGMAIGFTILGALLIYMLQKVVLLNLPLISDFIADIIRLVNNSMNQTP